jgi:hypothetical protein
MNIQILMDHSGDTRHFFDPTDRAAIKSTMDRFDGLVRRGYIAAKRTESGTC